MPKPIPPYTPPTREHLLSLSDGDFDFGIYGDLAGRYLCYLYTDLTPEAAATLPPLLFAAWVTRSFEWNIGQEGIETYFDNTRGKEIPLATAGYELLGMHQEAAYAKHLAEELAEELRTGELERDLPESLWDSWSDLFDTGDMEQEQQCTAYLRTHIDQVLSEMSTLQQSLDAARTARPA